MANIIRQIVADRAGATAIEYGLIAVLIVVAIMGSVVGLAGGVQSSFSRTSSSVGTATA